MTGIFVVLILVVVIIIYAFSEALARIGAAGYSPSKLISELLKKKSDKIDNWLTIKPVPSFKPSIMRWRTAAGILVSMLILYFTPFFVLLVGNTFYPYAFWPLLLATICVFVILWKKERKS